jgi:hypothetical protein
VRACVRACVRGRHTRRDYKGNDAAAYDDWVRARNHWDYFYNRS